MVSEVDVSELPLHEIQGFILSGYGDRPLASYAVFEILDPQAARAWIGRIVSRLQFGEYRRTPRDKPPFPNEMCLNIAFTHGGLAALNLDSVALSGFSLPFQEGLSEPNRARRLGDDQESAPNTWAWGYPGQRVHGVLMVFAGHHLVTPADYDAIRQCIDENVCAASGLSGITILQASPSDPVQRKEPFGFRDGIANPRFASLSKLGAFDAVPDGEFLLGYKNAYGRYPFSPELPTAADKGGDLPPSLERPTRKDFGKNGSYVVFRQLSQDVSAFWKFAFDAAARIPGHGATTADAEWLASRFVGRWPNGTTLARYPDAPGPENRDEQERFRYETFGDTSGNQCPIGSHVRRTNPRDTALPAPSDPDLSVAHKPSHLDLANKHRIMRRGRAYGPPGDPTFDPDVLRRGEDGGERGLHFLCVVADLNRQFEFVQSNWSLNPSFAGLSSDPDPLLGANRTFPFPATDFTIQGCPVRRVHDVPRFVEVRGGAYFFMPSRSALLHLGR